MIIQVKAVGLDNMRKFTNPDTYRKAARRSLQRAGTAGRAELPRAVKKLYTIKEKANEIKNRVRVQVDYNSPKLTLGFEGQRGVSLVEDYGARQTGKGFRFSMKKGSGWHYIRGEQTTENVHVPARVYYRGRKTKPFSTGTKMRLPFKAQMASGFDGVFMRKGMSRLPIKAFYGPGTGKIARDKEIVAVIQAKVNEVTRKEIEHNWNYFYAKTFK